MRVIFFSMYYSRFLLRVIVGLESTTNPLSVRWRWYYWNRRVLHRSDWY
ncbi:MAG TPA: hypothetical protein VHL50_02065 [Pyrinomonadaceae bacterium]|nr:hypothetical protein [Pyrinomonadaceae bacterium]